MKLCKVYYTRLISYHVKIKTNLNILYCRYDQEMSNLVLCSNFREISVQILNDFRSKKSIQLEINGKTLTKTNNNFTMILQIYMYFLVRFRG